MQRCGRNKGGWDRGGPPDLMGLVSKARQRFGGARKTIAEAEGYATEQVNRAQGDVSRFTAVLKEYQDAREVTRRRLYLETIGDILPKTKEIYIVDGHQRMVLPFLKQDRTQRSAHESGRPQN